MKRLLSIIWCLMSLGLAWAQTSDFSGKIINVGNAATELQTGKWYVLYNDFSKAYTLEGADNTLGVSTTSPSGADAQANAGYLVQLEETGTSGRYYLKSGLGNYYCNVMASRNNGTSAEVQTKYFFAINQFSTAGHWSLRSNGQYYLQNNGGKLCGGSSRGSEGGDRDWAFLEVSITDLGSLTGKDYVSFVLGKKNLVRLTNRRSTNSRLADNGTSTVGAAKNNNTLAQVWLLDKSGSGYTLRNANTGRFLNDDDNFRSPSATAARIFIQFSPNNSGSQAYINLSEKEDFSGNVCLNLNGDGTTLYKWTCQNDQGSDWSIALAENFTIEEVEAHLLEQSGLYEPQEGKYYRIKNMGKSNYINEDIGANVLTCESKDETKLSQYWTLVKTSDGRYNVQNLCTQRNIVQKNGSLSSQYTTNFGKTNTFSIQRTNDVTNLTYYILDTSSVGLHCDASNTVVGWYSNATNSVWGFEEVQLDEAFIEEGRARLNAFTDLQRHANTYKAALANLFQDKACTELKDEIQALSDEALAENADFIALNDDMKAMVLKVKNNTWESFTSSTGYTREGFEKFFRVRDDYNVYSHYQKMTWNEYAGMSNSFGKLSGPTGIVGKAGDIIYIYVDKEPSTDCTLQAEIVMDSDSPGDHQTGSTTTLHAGLNTILISTPSTVYIFYQLNDPEKYLANYPAAKIHIEGGELQGYFDYTRGMTNQDWTLLYEKLLKESKVINLKCDRVVFAMLASLVKSAIGKTGEAEGLMRIWNNFIECEENLMGFKEDLAGRFRNVWNAFSINYNYMFATTYGTYYENSTLSTVMNYNALTSSGGAIWGPSHEIGHNHQSCINIVGATEVSNNLFSNVNVFLHGISTTRGSTVTKTLEHFANGTGWFGMGIWEQTRMYFQLYLYFHAQGHKPDFYPTLFKMLRKDPIRKRTGPSSSSLVDGDGNIVSGVITYGKDDYLHLAKKMCDAAQLDLSEFFEVNGMFVPYDKYFIGDYSNYWVTTTQADIDAAKAYMHRYPKAPSICFIDDRIKVSPATSDGPFEGKPKSTNRANYDSEVSIGYADVGQWSDFVDDYQTNGYYYITSTSSGKTTYAITGTGAIGFKVYDNDGNLIYLSNKKRFTIPANIQAKMADGFKIVACEANGYEVLVPYGPSTNRGEMTAYYEGNPTPHTLYYYGTGAAGVSEMNPLPANSIAYVKPGQTEQKQPTAELLANVNVVGPDSVARSLVIDGDKPFFIPTEFTAENISFTKSGEGYQALRLPFDTWAGLGIVREDGTVDNAPETFAAGEPVLFKDAVSISEPSSGDALTHETFGRLVHEGTFAETESGYIFDGSSFVLAENISPFTFIWDDPNGVQDLKEDFKDHTDLKNLDNAFYNMAGQRVGKPSKGLYIKGGRKVLIK
ncbi:MAG: M60 family metallopeptidase [Bacteroidaceae bacterium]|nr:M60 family metallopeptidase [Bacteroidaceae bacterium]